MVTFKVSHIIRVVQAMKWFRTSKTIKRDGSELPTNEYKTEFGAGSTMPARH
jgi:hypothetical protein